MNYTLIYNSLVQRAKERTVLNESYVEVHHIIPISFDGLDTEDNTVTLTAREHFIAHLLLAKIYGGKMWFAARRMSCYKKYTSKQYAWLKSAFYTKYFTEMMTGRKRSSKSKKRMSDAQKKLYADGYVSPTLGKKKSMQEREDMSKRAFDYYQTEDGVKMKKLLSETNTGKKYAPRTEEFKREHSKKRILFLETEAGIAAKLKISLKAKERQRLRKELGLGRTGSLPKNLDI